LDIKKAALYIAQELRFSHQLGGLQRSIEQARGELKMLNMTITQKQPLITTLLKLQQNGVIDDDIIGLSKILDIGRMAKEWRPLSPRPIPKTDVGMGMNQGLNYNIFNWNYGFPIGLEQGKSSNPGNGGSSNPAGYSQPWWKLTKLSSPSIFFQ